MSFRLPLRLLRGSYVRLTLTVVALACGVALVCAVDLTSRVVFQAFVEVIDTMAGRAALQVRAGEGAAFPEEIAETVGSVPGVDLAVPVVSATAFTSDDPGELLTVQGVDIGQDAAVRLYDSRDESGLELDDALSFLSQPDSVALTRTFMARRGLQVGDRIDLDTPTGRQRFTVRGALEPRGVARVYGGNLVVMDILGAERAFTGAGLVNRVDVAIRPETDLGGVREAIGAVLPPGLRVEAPAQRKTDLNKSMQAFALILRGVALLGLGAAMLIAFNRVGAVFEANVWQLGVLQAVGASPLAVWLVLLKEALLLGVAGAVVGVPLGIGLGRLALPVLARAMALANNLTPTEAAFGVAPWSLVVAAATGVGAAIVAAALPAWRAARLGIAATLRSRGIEQPATMSVRMWVFRLLVGAGIFATIALQWRTRAAAWGLGATVLIATAVALAARPLLQLIGARLIGGLRWLAGPSARFVGDSVLHNPRRSSLTAAMLGVGLATVLWLWMLGRSFEESVLDLVRGVVQAELVVTSAHVASGFVESPVDGALIGELRALPGVAAVAGERLLEWQYGGGPIFVNAFDHAFFVDPRLGRWPLIGEQLPDVWEQVLRGEAAIASTNFMLNLGKRVGDAVTLDTPSGPHELRIGGVIADLVSPRGTLEISRELYQRLWRDRQVSRIYVETNTPGGVQETSAAIARTLGRKYRLRILSVDDFADHLAGQVRQAFASFYVLAGMILLVVLVGMADTLAGAVAERARALGVLRAVGVESVHLRRMVLAEAATLGALGVVLALLGGLAMGGLWVQTTFPYLFGWVLRPYVPYVPSLVVTLVSLTVCMLAALVPARRAAAVDPATALRYE